jgi:hypothetical protein
MGAHDVAHGYEPWITEADVSEDLRDPDLHLDTDTWVVEDGDRLVGYGELWNARLEEARALEALCWTAPTHLDRGIVSTLVDRTEEAGALAARGLARCCCATSSGRTMTPHVRCWRRAATASYGISFTWRSS